MRAWILPLAFALACGPEADEPAASGDDTGAASTVDPDAFMVVVLPDTQIYSQSHPETFAAMTRWIAEHRDEHGIVFVTHVGDIVQHANAPDEWEAAQAAIDWLEDADIPHGFSAGSHDFSRYGESDHDNSCANFANLDCELTDFLENFGPDRYADRAWWGGSSPSGRSSYQLVSAGGLDLLFLHLMHDTPRAEVDWAHAVLDAHPGALAHLTTHRYLFDYRLTDAMPSPLNTLPSGRFNEVTYLLGGQSLLFHDALKANELFEEVVAAHPNIWGVHCGHVDGEFKQVSENDAGLPVYEILNDYQDMADGGGGWMRLLTFRPNFDEVVVQTYSPLTDSYRQNGDGFDHSVHILESYMGAAEEALESLGADMDALRALLEAVKADTPERAAYYDSLYAGGARDSEFVLHVDFSAYRDAAR